jgi:hypothetical protein
MKKNFKIILYIIILLLFFPCVVEAKKNLENTCVYNAKNKKDKDITITCKFYDDGSYSKCDIGTTFKQPIENWNNPLDDSLQFSETESAKSWYKNNHKCLPYIVYVDAGRSVDRYLLYASESLTRANGVVMFGDTWDYYTSIGILQGTDEDTTDPYAEQKEKINSYIEILNDLVASFGLENCLVDGKIDTDPNSLYYHTCLNKISAMYEQFDEYDKYVQEQIDNGIFSENDEIIENYKSAVNNAKSQIDEELDSVREGTINATIDATTSDIDLTTSELDCNGIFSGNFGTLLKDILSLLRFAVPILIIGLSTVDFVKSAAAQDQSEIKKSANKLVKRLVIGILIFLLPTLLDLILDLAGIEYGTCGIR